MQQMFSIQGGGVSSPQLKLVAFTPIFQVIVLEDLNVSGMLANHCLAQAINDVGFAEFRRQVKYKSLWYGSELLLADRFFPSSRICRYCGCINSELKLSDREWTCDCGAVLDRDLNAAINLKNLAINLP